VSLRLQENIRVIRVIRDVFNRKLASKTSPEKSTQSSCAPSVALGEDGIVGRARVRTHCAFTRTKPVLLGENIEEDALYRELVA
jgi:hypothetical protein